MARAFSLPQHAPRQPYFYVFVKDKYVTEVEEFLRRTFAKEVSAVGAVEKEDLDLVNHLSGLKRRYIKVSFLTVQALLSVRAKLLGKVAKVTAPACAASFTHATQNRRRLGIDETYMETAPDAPAEEGTTVKDLTDFIYDIREYDVTYYQRFAVDKGIRVGFWYMASMETGVISLEKRADLMDRVRMKVMAFDIETTHAPMRFPDSEVDW